MNGNRHKKELCGGKLVKDLSETREIVKHDVKIEWSGNMLSQKSFILVISNENFLRIINLGMNKSIKTIFSNHGNNLKR